jgi:hypothetical protein
MNTNIQIVQVAIGGGARRGSASPGEVSVRGNRLHYPHHGRRDAGRFARNPKIMNATFELVYLVCAGQEAAGVVRETPFNAYFTAVREDRDVDAVPREFFIWTIEVVLETQRKAGGSAACIKAGERAQAALRTGGVVHPAEFDLVGGVETICYALSIPLDQAWQRVADKLIELLEL